MVTGILAATVGVGQQPLARQPTRYGFFLRKGWGGSQTWARAQSVLRSVWRTCWQQGRFALDVLSQPLRGAPVVLALPP
jgi:hypothetical protein